MCCVDPLKPQSSAEIISRDVRLAASERLAVIRAKPGRRAHSGQEPTVEIRAQVKLVATSKRMRPSQVCTEPGAFVLVTSLPERRQLGQMGDEYTDLLSMSLLGQRVCLPKLPEKPVVSNPRTCRVTDKTASMIVPRHRNCSSRWWESTKYGIFGSMRSKDGQMQPVASAP